MHEVIDEPLATSGISSACYERLNFSLIIALVPRLSFGIRAVTSMLSVKIHCSSVLFGFSSGGYRQMGGFSSLELYFIDVVLKFDRHVVLKLFCTIE